MLTDQKLERHVGNHMPDDLAVAVNGLLGNLSMIGSLYGLSGELRVDHGHGLLVLSFRWDSQGHCVDLCLDGITSDLEQTRQVVRMMPAELWGFVLPRLTEADVK